MHSGGSRAYVFGYGSLLARNRDREPGPQIAHLAGFRRTWNVAMDNSVDLPGYKYYLAPDGSRPRLFVTFLNITHSDGGTLNGMLFAAAGADLAALDARERNYARTEVTDRIVGAPPGRVWTYVGTPEAVARYERGARDQAAAVSRGYYDAVIGGFAALGDRALGGFHASTDPPACPILDLERVDL
jgi:cation transport regulator ChaC